MAKCYTEPSIKRTEQKARLKPPVERLMMQTNDTIGVSVVESITLVLK